MKPGRGLRPSRSARLTDAARTRTSTWPSAGVGRSMSLSSTTSGEPYRNCWAAFMPSPIYFKQGEDIKETAGNVANEIAVISVRRCYPPCSLVERTEGRQWLA